MNERNDIEGNANTRITDDRMTSGLTTHVATRQTEPVPGVRGWLVSWLPGRVLDHNRAITAMTIAEIVESGNPDVTLLQSLAHELGMSGDEAARLVSMGREGSRPTCPSWCTERHENYPEDRDTGSGTHWGPAAAINDAEMVFLDQEDGEEPTVWISMPTELANLVYSIEEARKLRDGLNLILAAVDADSVTRA